MEMSSDLRIPSSPSSLDILQEELFVLTSRAEFVQTDRYCRRRRPLSTPRRIIDDYEDAWRRELGMLDDSSNDYDTVAEAENNVRMPKKMNISETSDYAEVPESIYSEVGDREHHKGGVCQSGSSDYAECLPIGGYSMGDDSDITEVFLSGCSDVHQQCVPVCSDDYDSVRDEVVWVLREESEPENIYQQVFPVNKFSQKCSSSSQEHLVPQKKKSSLVTKLKGLCKRSSKRRVPIKNLRKRMDAYKTLN